MPCPFLSVCSDDVPQAIQSNNLKEVEKLRSSTFYCGVCPWPTPAEYTIMAKTMCNKCDRICKKGSYTRTTSTHRFHHHSIDTLSDNPWVHVLWPTVHQSAFPEAVSGTRQTSMSARFVSSCPCWLLNKGHRAVRSHTAL